MLFKYLNRFKRAVKNKKIISFLLIASYILGIVLGFILKGNTEDNIFYYFVINYRNIIFGLYANPIKLTFIRLINNLFSFLIIYLLCYSYFLIALNLIVFMYRGIILGSIAILFFEVLGIQGLIVFILLVIIQNLLVTLGLFFTTIIVYDLKSFCKKKYTDNVYLKYFLIGFIISIFAAIYELILLLCFFRPLNIYF